MTLNGGLGDVVSASKNTEMPDRAPITCEKITAVRHCNGIDWWIVTHDQSAAGSSSYRVWLFSAAGIDPTPVVSSVGTAVTTTDGSVGVVNNGYGWLVGNNAGDKLMMASYGMNVIDYTDFDNATGIVSNPLIITSVNHPYGLEFSANDEVLYVSSNDLLLQFDLTQPDAAQIEASSNIIYTNFDESSGVRAIRMAPDGQIYVSLMLSTFLGVIASPNTLGPGCNFSAQGFDLPMAAACLWLAPG